MKEEQTKHLEIIQGVIARMASNSFLIKGWSLTLIVGLFVLSSKEANYYFVFLPLIPLITFWGLDTFYLRKERLFRMLYDDARKSYLTDSHVVELFSMDTNKYQSLADPWFKCLFTNSVVWFHAILLIVIVVTIVLFPQCPIGGN